MMSTRSNTCHSPPSTLLRIVALLLIPIQASLLGPPNLLAAVATAPASDSAKAKKPTVPPDPTKGTKINHTVPKVAPATSLSFSKEPKDNEFEAIHVFAEPLIPVGGKTTVAENR